MLAVRSVVSPGVAEPFPLKENRHDRGRQGVHDRETVFAREPKRQQRRYRAGTLCLPPGEHAHWLKKEDADRGRNFYGRAHCEVMAPRGRTEKGVDLRRTQGNMLSSQAMCFNIFGNLRTPEGLLVAAKALRRFVPTIQDVKQIHIEYTPTETFSAIRPGAAAWIVTCLIEYSTAHGGGLLFCRDRSSWKRSSALAPSARGAAKARQRPRVVSEWNPPQSRLQWVPLCQQEGYHYWRQRPSPQDAEARSAPRRRTVPVWRGLWQLWVNHTLVYAEARERGLQEAAFAVCAPRNNDGLLKGGKTSGRSRNLLTDPRSMLSHSG